MKETGTNKSTSPQKFVLITAMAIIIGSVPFLVSCSQIKPTGQTTSPSSAVITQDVSNNESITLSATPDSAATVSTNGVLTAVEKALSLQGYGAAGAEKDENMSIADMLMYAIQDEYLAHGEYIKIVALFGNVNPYVNIIKSEESHIAFLSNLYVAYGLTLPADDSAGHLVVPKDLLVAAKTGVQAEIDNIAMYEKFMTHALPQDILSVFTTLKIASESHLSAFERQVDKLS